MASHEHNRNPADNERLLYVKVDRLASPKMKMAARVCRASVPANLPETIIAARFG
jgi:hypothetical protein